ncbi:unnamed protein product [Rotaria socialis]|uniref:Reverse transcriptase domain-containing protein n=1 Tax=Rotaria socialis TaxID=392032 RepID=A0A817ZF27_9BILA|nr:unnamed protein product [Rotaria socialis]
MRTQIEQLTRHIEDAEQREQLQQILWKHGKLFDLRQPPIIKATIHHAIETGTHSPIYTSPYRVSYKDEQKQREEIEKLLEQGVIEESTSPWSSPIEIKQHYYKDPFPMPRIDDIFDHLLQAEYYTTVDFKSGYFQVGLDPKDRPKTAFPTRDQHYQFTVLPQSVTNGPPAFQRIVSQILGLTRWKYSLAYLDDVIIYSTTFKEHLLHLNDILNRLNDANFRLNVTKCQIARTSIDYLGHHIQHRIIRPNADNIRALLETQQPISTEEAFRFVKAAEYYRKFIPEFSTIAQPLHQYAPTTKEQRTKKSQATPITLSNDALDAFNKLKRILTNDLVLRIPDQNLPFKIQTNASKIGVGAVLMQTHPNDGQSFSIETDHKPLLPFNSKQQLNSKCERWRLKLQQYRFTIKYIKGKHNTVADYLSRSPVDNGSNDEDDYTPTKSASTQTDEYMKTKIVAPVITRNHAKQQVAERSDLHSVDRTCEVDTRKRNVDMEVVQSWSTQYNQCHTPAIPNEMQQIIPFTWEQLKEAQHQDEEIKNVINDIRNHKKYFIKDNMLMKKACPPVPVIPKGRIRSDIIKIYHDTLANGAHFGRDRTINKIQQRYFWPGIISDIHNFIKSCLLCSQNNPLRQKPPGAFKQIKPPDGIWQLLTMDFHGPITPTTKNGNKYTALSNEKRTNWDEQLPFVTFNYNTTIHRTTNQIPFELIYGRKPILPFDQQQPLVTLSQDPEHKTKLNQHLSVLTEQPKATILEQQRKYREHYDRYRTNPIYKINDIILVKTLNKRNKFDIIYEGPFKITQQLGKTKFIVEHIKKHTLVRQVTIDVIIPLCERKRMD